MASCEPEGASPYCFAPPGCHEDEWKMIKARVTKEQAVKAVRRWWYSPLIALGLKRDGRIMECSLKYMPFWKIMSNVKGFVEGYRTAEDEVYHHQKIDRDYVCNIVACDARDIGIRQLRRLQGNIIPYDLLPEQTLEATVSRREACYICGSAMEKAAAVSARVSFPVSTYTSTSPIDHELIFYPLWIIKYVYGEDRYSATVDGVGGRVLAGRAPGEPILRSMASGVGMAILVIGAVLYLWIQTAYIDIACCSFFIILIFCLMAVIEASEFNDNGSVIVKGEYKDGYKPFRYLEYMRYKAGGEYVRVDSYEKNK